MTFLVTILAKTEAGIIETFCNMASLKFSDDMTFDLQRFIDARIEEICEMSQTTILSVSVTKI